ncbi:MAG: metal ABC transporter substrate-binding protein [Nocardioidaceae bacterium]
MRSHSPAFLGTIVSALLLSGCGGTVDSSSGTTVVASFYPFAYAAERVGGDAVDVDNLTAPGVEPHDIELAPQQIAEVQDADLAIFETGFQPAVDEAVEQAELSDEAALDVAETVSLVDADEHAPAGHAHEESEEHEHGELDPHVWLDPTTMIAVTEAVADRLTQIDPDNAKTYQRNARTFIAELTDLDHAFKTGLANCERHTIVTSHDAFGYLADRYGLEQVGIAGVDPSSEPSPAQLADITDLVRDDGITTIFTEELVSPAVAETVADETGAEVATLDPIEGLGDDTADQTYLTLMKQNLDALKEANGCS